jgi:hypothetical protein
MTVAGTPFGLRPTSKTPTRMSRALAMLCAALFAIAGGCASLLVVVVAIANDPDTNTATGAHLGWGAMLLLGVIGSITAGVVFYRSQWPTQRGRPHGSP